MARRSENSGGRVFSAPASRAQRPKKSTTARRGKNLAKFEGNRTQVMPTKSRTKKTLQNGGKRGEKRQPLGAEHTTPESVCALGSEFPSRDQEQWQPVGGETRARVRGYCHFVDESLQRNACTPPASGGGVLTWTAVTDCEFSRMK